MKRIVWAFIVVVLGLGCKQKVPDGIIEREKMEGILFDIHLVDGYLSSIYVQDSARKVGAAYYKGIYKKYDTDSIQYSKSLTYYNQNPELLKEMYNVISNKMDKQKIALKRADSLWQKKKFRADSLKIIKTFKADSLTLVKKAKPDSLSRVKANAQIKKKRKQADSLINTKRSNVNLVIASPTLVQ